MLGQYEEAIASFRRSMAGNPGYSIGEAYLAAALALAGKDFEARETLATYLSLPLTKTKTIDSFKRQTLSESPGYLAMRDRLYEGLRKAGMPEK